MAISKTTSTETSSVSQIFIRGSKGTNVFNLTTESAFRDLKTFVQGILRTDAFSLYCSGRPLCEKENLAYLASSTLDVVVPLCGGKVHGSLARAGKVRSQTPKVEQEEKKKKKTGRAKKRAQYNKRFVNGVAVDNKKKGPNSRHVLDLS